MPLVESERLRNAAGFERLFCSRSLENDGAGFCISRSRFDENAEALVIFVRVVVGEDGLVLLGVTSGFHL